MSAVVSGKLVRVIEPALECFINKSNTIDLYSW